MSHRKDDDEEEVNSEAGEEGKNTCSMLLTISLRFCQITSPLQNAGGVGQRQATAASKQTSAFQKGYNDYTRRCGR